MYWILFCNFHLGWIGQFFIFSIQPCFCHRGCRLRFLRNQRCNVVFKSSQKCGLTSKWFPNSIPSISRIIKTLYRAQLATVQLCDYCYNQAAQQLQIRIQRTNGSKFASLIDSGSIHPEKKGNKSRLDRILALHWTFQRCGNKWVVGVVLGTFRPFSRFCHQMPQSEI